MDKKPHKVEEPQAPYAAQKPAKDASALKQAPATAEFDRITNKLLRERRELLHKLAK